MAQWYDIETDNGGWPIMDPPAPEPAQQRAQERGNGDEDPFAEAWGPAEPAAASGPSGLFDPEPSSQRPAAARPVSARPGRVSTRSSRTKTRLGGRTKTALAGGALVLVLLVGGGAVAAHFVNGDDPVEAQQATPLERTTPPGWSQDTSWSTAADPQSNIAVADDRIAFLNGSGVLVVLDALTGETVFSSTPTGANLGSSTVSFTQAEGTPVVMVIESGSFTTWSLGDDLGESRTNSIPTSATVSTSGDGALVITEDETWSLNGELEMAEVKGLPEDGVPLAVTLDGAVVVGSPDGGWSLIVDDEAEEVDTELAEGAKGEVMYPAWSSKGVVAAWAPMDDDKERAVGLYDATSGELLANTVMPTEQVNLGLPLTVTPQAKLAAVGNWLVDLERGESEQVDGWSTSVAVQGAIYGSVGDQKKVWEGSGQVQDIAGDAALPWGVTSTGDGIFLSEDDGSPVLSGVKPQ